MQWWNESRASPHKKTWYDIIWAYDHEKKKELFEREEVTCSQFAVVCLLMYLVMGDDWPYHIATNFNSLSDDSPLKGFPGIGILRHHSNLGYLLKEMEKDGLVIGRRDKTSLNPTDIYRLNPNIIRSPFVDSISYEPDSHIVEIPDEIVIESLRLIQSIFDPEYNLHKKGKSKRSSYEIIDRRRKEMIKTWESVEKFEFTTFLISIKDISSFLINYSDNMSFHKFPSQIEEYIVRFDGSLSISPFTRPEFMDYAIKLEQRKVRAPYSRKDAPNYREMLFPE